MLDLRSRRLLAVLLGAAMSVVGLSAGAFGHWFWTASAGLGVIFIVLALTADLHRSVKPTTRALARAQRESQQEVAALLSEVRATRSSLQKVQERQRSADELQSRRFAMLGSRVTTELDVMSNELQMAAHALLEQSARMSAALGGDSLAARGESDEADSDAPRTPAQLLHLMAERGDAMHSMVGALRHEFVTEMDALLQLHRRLPWEAEPPLLWGWALSPRAMLQLMRAVDLLPERPTVVECGSGTSSIYLGHALAARGGGRLISLEHLAEFAEVTRREVAQHGLSDTVDVRLAPLEEVEVDGRQQLWYSASTYEDVESVDLLLVDGPPQATGELARLPAFPLLQSQLAHGAYIALDDAQRKEEREVLRMWRRRAGLTVVRSLTPNLALMRWNVP